MVAAACMRIGNRDCALRWPQEGFEERDDLMINLKAEHVFDNLGVDRAFKIPWSRNTTVRVPSGLFFPYVGWIDQVSRVFLYLIVVISDSAQSPGKCGDVSLIEPNSSIYLV